MDLSEVFDRYPGVRVLNSEDNEIISNFFLKSSMKDKFGITYDRKPDFFRHLKYRSSDYLVFGMLLEDQLQGICSINFRPGFMEGKLRNVGLLSDLRIQPSLKVSSTLRKAYSEIIQNSKKISQFNCCGDFSTVIVRSEEHTSELQSQR